MNAETLLSDKSWCYRVRIARAATGHLYAHLVGAEGMVGAILSTRLTNTDELIRDGKALYAELLNRGAAATDARAKISKPKTHPLKK